MSTVAIFCSARKIDRKYRKLARSVGRTVAKEGFDVIYGGGRQGLMGDSAVAAMKAGAMVRGISTHLLMGLEAKIEDSDHTFFVKDMGERKQIQLEVADHVVILPGGFGTMDELFETITFNQLGITKNNLIVFDTEIAPVLQELCRIMIDRGTVSQSDVDKIQYVNNLKELKDALHR